MVLKASLEKKNGWQEFTFKRPVTMRHLCFEALSSYDDKFSCISEIELLDEAGKSLPKDTWQIVYANTEQAGEGYAEQMIDDDLSSYWHSQWTGNVTPFPHRVIVDLGEIQAVKGIRVRQRSASMAGCVKDFCLYGRPQFFLFK